MSRTIWVGAVAYDPKVVSIWEGMRRYFHEEARLSVEVVLFQTYEAQVAALLVWDPVREPQPAADRVAATSGGSDGLGSYLGAHILGELDPDDREFLVEVSPIDRVEHSARDSGSLRGHAVRHSVLHH